MTDDRSEFEANRVAGLAKRHERRLARLPEHLRGDGPCQNCGTDNNIVWFTDNVLWNDVILNGPEAMDKILCIPCFIKETDERGWHVTGWRLIPEFHYETKAEAAARKERTA